MCECAEWLDSNSKFPLLPTLWGKVLGLQKTTGFPTLAYRVLPSPTLCLTFALSCSFAKLSDSFATPWTVAHRASMSMRISRQEYCGGLQVPPPEDLPRSRIKPVSPALAGRFFTTEPLGKLWYLFSYLQVNLLSFPTELTRDKTSHIFWEHA